MALLPGSGAFAATGYTISTIALEGSSAPGTSDAFDAFLDVTVDEAGRVAFVATLDDPHTGVFLATPIAPIAVPLLTGPALPVLALLFTGTAAASLRRVATRQRASSSG